MLGFQSGLKMQLGVWRRTVRGFVAVTAATLAMLSAAPPGSAAMAVVDVRAITQLVNQIRTLQSQLETARSHLTQARQAFDSMTGGRGMERLLAGTVRNYLPADWRQLTDAISGAAGAYGSLGDSVQRALQEIAVLPEAQLQRMTVEERRAVEAARRSAAALRGLAEQALANTSGRFAALQQLVNAIAGARDPKAILDLQARIGAEQGMLQNEQTKLQMLGQAMQAQAWVNGQRERELLAVSLGEFGARFQPVP